MEEKYKKFKEYDWVRSQEWQIYYDNIYPTPPPNKLLRCKKRFYRNKIDPDFDIDYVPPEGESTSTSSSSHRATPPPQQNTSYKPQEQPQTVEQAFETYRAAQSMANPINSSLLMNLETILLVGFIVSLPFKYRTSLFAILAFLVRSIRLAGIPKFEMVYVQIFIMNDAAHSLLFTMQSLSDRLNYYMIFPIVISAVVALCENLHRAGATIGKKYIDLVVSKREEIIQSKSHVEIAIGFITIAGIFLKINSILTPIIYWQLMRVRYTINPYTRQSFKEINNIATKFKDSQSCPGIVKTIIEKVQSIIGYMGNMTAPQSGQAQNQDANQGGGSMCQIF